MRPFEGLTPERRIRALLVLRGMTQSDLADSLGVSQTVVSRLMSGRYGWGREISMKDVAEILGVDHRAVRYGTHWPDMSGGG